jgi:hypothetical protein
VGEPNPSSDIVKTRECRIVLLLSLLAAVHVLIFSAVFPFFNVVDEQQHFDMVVRYSHADIPRAVEPLSNEAMNFIAIYHTPEYFWPPSNFPGGKIPSPAWTLPINVAAQNLLDIKALWKAKVKNQEASQPPLYYTLTACWWHLGKWLGLDGGRILYWLRFLNAFFMVALVWLGHIAARIIFPNRWFLRIGVPAVLAFLPQSAFYAIQNDVLSPLCFGTAFILLVKFWRLEIPDARLGVYTGLAVSATFLAKISSAPLLAVSAAFVALKILQLTRAGKLRAAAPAIGSLALCAALPVALWLAWCKYNFGDLTGSEPKIQFLGWTHKPFTEWWSHPIFTPHGFWAFFTDLFATFWRGELLWHRKPLALPLVDFIYVISTVIFLGLALAGLLSKSVADEKKLRPALWFGFACFAAAVTFLGFLSIVYDFHDCFRPSRDFPYFTSGRMMLGVLIPFLLLYLYGLDRVLDKIKSQWLRPFVLTVMILFMLASEITIDWRIFPNEYNWFHM